MPWASEWKGRSVEREIREIPMAEIHQCGWRQHCEGEIPDDVRRPLLDEADRQRAEHEPDRRDARERQKRSVPGASSPDPNAG